MSYESVKKPMAATKHVRAWYQLRKCERVTYQRKFADKHNEHVRVACIVNVLQGSSPALVDTWQQSGLKASGTGSAICASHLCISTTLGDQDVQREGGPLKMRPFMSVQPGFIVTESM